MPANPSSRFPTADDTKQQQILGLGRLGWTLSRIQQTTGVRRETISAAGVCAGSSGGRWWLLRFRFGR